MPIAVVAAVSFAFFALTSGWLTDVLDYKFLPDTAFDGLRAQLDRRETQAAAPALLVIGELLLAAAFARARAWLPLAFLGAAIAGNWFVGGHGFDITLGISVVIALLALLERSGAAARAAAARGRSRPRTRALVDVPRHLGPACRDRVRRRCSAVGSLRQSPASRRAYAVVAVATVLAAAVVGGERTDRDDTPTLSPAHYEIWREVRERVPGDGHRLHLRDRTA